MFFINKNGLVSIKKKFKIYKFATMLKDSPNLLGGIITTTNDPRITPMGSFLRKSKINELPQLFNIIIGQMSFIGPRPVMQKSFDSYPKSVKKVIIMVFSFYLVFVFILSCTILWFKIL